MPDGGLLDLELYVAIIDYLREAQQASERGRLTWANVSHDWAADQQGLAGEGLDYFLLGITRLGGHPWKGSDWERQQRNKELDRVVWTFHRAWTDLCGYLYPLDQPPAPWEKQ